MLGFLLVLETEQNLTDCPGCTIPILLPPAAQWTHRQFCIILGKRVGLTAVLTLLADKRGISLPEIMIDSISSRSLEKTWVLLSDLNWLIACGIHLNQRRYIKPRLKSFQLLPVFQYILISVRVKKDKAPCLPTPCTPQRAAPPALLSACGRCLHDPAVNWTTFLILCTTFSK